MSEVEFIESRSRDLRLDVTVPEGDRVEREQPYSREARRYQVQWIKARAGTTDGEERTLRITFHGPLVTKAGLSSKVKCDETFWNPDEGLAACPESVRSLIVPRVAAWRAEATS